MHIMVTVNTSDLEFILQQIKIAEADARGEQILGGLVPTSELPWGLRRVDGSNNHLVPGQETYGAADQQFPRATTPVWVAEGDDGMSFGPPRLDANNVPIPSGVPGIPDKAKSQARSQRCGTLAGRQKQNCSPSRAARDCLKLWWRSTAG
jgi:hypothetical protein